MPCYKRHRFPASKQTVKNMKLFIIIALCSMAAFADDAKITLDKKYVPRYTLLSESKKQDQDLDVAGPVSVANELQPWRRFAHTGGHGGGGGGGGGGQQTGQGISLGAVQGQGLMLLGINLGALLYMLLGLLGLAPSNRFGGVAYNAADFYRQHFDAGKETNLYF